MEQTSKPAPARRRHLLTEAQLAPRPDAGEAAPSGAHRHGNGVRVHVIYILVVALAALVLLGVAIALADAPM